MRERVFGGSLHQHKETGGVFLLAGAFYPKQTGDTSYALGKISLRISPVHCAHVYKMILKIPRPARIASSSTTATAILWVSHLGYPHRRPRLYVKLPSLLSHFCLPECYLNAKLSFLAFGCVFAG